MKTLVANLNFIERGFLTDLLIAAGVNTTDRYDHEVYLSELPLLKIALGQLREGKSDVLRRFNETACDAYAGFCEDSEVWDFLTKLLSKAEGIE